MAKSVGLLVVRNLEGTAAPENPISDRNSEVIPRARKLGLGEISFVGGLPFFHLIEEMLLERCSQERGVRFRLLERLVEFLDTAFTGECHQEVLLSRKDRTRQGPGARAARGILCEQGAVLARATRAARAMPARVTPTGRKLFSFAGEIGLDRPTRGPYSLRMLKKVKHATRSFLLKLSEDDAARLRLVAIKHRLNPTACARMILVDGLLNEEKNLREEEALPA